MAKTVVLTPLSSAEAPSIIRDLWQLAHMNTTEGELKRIIIERKVFKATIDQIPFGVITLTPKPLTEMTVWLSEKETRETWAEAIKKAILQAFSAPEVYRVKLSIPASCKDMLIVAEGCGFENQVELLEEGPNREPLIAFGLSRDGSSSNDSLQSSLSIEKQKLIKDGLERKILSLEAELNTANQKIKKLESEIESLKKEFAALSKNDKSELGKNEEIILKLVIDHPDGIKQQQIIKKTGIVQSEVSKCVRILAKIGLVINQKVGIERLVKPVLEETEKPEAKPESELETNQKVESALKKLLNPEISLVKGLSLKELGIEPEKAEKFVEAVKATGHCHIIGSAKDPENCFIRLKKIDLSRNKGGAEKTEPDPLRPKETQTAVIPIEELLEGEKERLNACFSTPSKFIKAKGEILEALKSGKPIGAEIFGSHHSIKKSELPAVIMLLCKEINDDNKEKGKPLVKEIKIRETPDYADSVIEIITASEISEQKITKDKEEVKKPVTIKPEKVEEVDEEPALKASEKILAKLSQTHREIFYAIEKAGGSLTKTALKNEVGISKEVLELCISTLAENGLVTSDLENVSLNNMT